MSTFDIESLLSEVSPEARCGEDISGDSEYFELWDLVRPRSTSAVPTDEDQVAEPNWGQIGQKSFALLQRSRDLRVALYFALALLATQGVPGLRDGLRLIRGLLEHFWDDVHPRLDPEDNNDPTERINVLMPLSSQSASDQDPVQFRSRLLRVPLCNSRQAGSFSVRDIQLARGERAVPEGAQDAPQISIINAAFRETAPDELQNTLQAARQAMEHLDGIRDVFEQRTTEGIGPDLGGLRTDLKKVCDLLVEYVGGGSDADAETQSETTTAPSTGKTQFAATGEIQSRADALALIEKACRYFERHEPSSPVPLLLRRAQRLAPKTFLEIIEDVCPDAIGQVTVVSGTVGTGQDDGEAGA